MQFMMPHAHVVKSQVAYEILGLLDHLQLLLRYRFAPGNARTEAGHLRFVRRRQSQPGGQFADFLLGQADSNSRRGKLGESAMTASNLSPKPSRATWARKTESTPPE